ncbi:MAG: PHP domain-containing protein [Gemmiger sp.]|nr:PHP domain-containing protein [Gemmiger sp.]
MYTVIADLHTHTLASSHAYDTLDGMALAAAGAGLKALAITDHGPAMPDAPHAWHFGNRTALPRLLHGVALLHGAEVNVMDTLGGLDFTEKQLAAFDWVVASIHSPCIPGTLSEREATRLWLAVAETPYVDCIGHSEQENYRYDYKTVARAFAKNHKVVELNGNSLNVRKDGIPNMRSLLLACKEAGCKIALNSDAHSAMQLEQGVKKLYPLLAEVAFPPALVVNGSTENLLEELKLHNRRVAEELGGIVG